MKSLTTQLLKAFTFTITFRQPRLVESFASKRLPRNHSSRILLNRVDMTATSNDEKPLGARPIRVLGVCGGIGSGKSTVCKLLVSDLGCYAHIDADSLAHTVYEPGSQAIQHVANEFGPEILQESGEINRPALGAIVFGSREAMAKLERIVWPFVQEKIEEKISEYSASFQSEDGDAKDKLPVVIVEAAVLLDAGWHETFLDGVWTVMAEEKIALQRLMDTRGLSQEEADKRMQAQKSRRGIGNLEAELEIKTVTAKITNDGSLDELKQTLSKVLSDDSAWYAKKFNNNAPL